MLKERSRHNWAGQQVNKGFSDTVSLITGANNLLRLTNNQLGFVGLGGTVSTKVQNFLHPLDHPKVYYTAGRRISQEYDKYLLAQAECNLGVSEQSLTNNGRTLKHNVEVHFHNAYSQIHFDDTADPNKSDLKKYSNEKEKKG